MTTYWLKINLESDAAFGRGDGVPGIVDAEVQHEGESGLVYISGKTLKGLLTASCAEIIDALTLAGNDAPWRAPAARLFGSPGHKAADMGNLHVGDARLPDYVRGQVLADPTLSRQKVLESLTNIRTQTAIDPETGAPKDHSLRSIRVILRNTPFVARIEHDLWKMSPAPEAEQALLAACVKGLRRAGTSRNRGLGKIQIDMYTDNPFTADPMPTPVTKTFFQEFAKGVITV